MLHWCSFIIVTRDVCCRFTFGGSKLYSESNHKNNNHSSTSAPFETFFFCFPKQQRNRNKWLTLLFLCVYIPLQKYTVPKNETLRYRLGLDRPTPMPAGTQRSEVRRWEHVRCPPQFSLLEWVLTEVSVCISLFAFPHRHTASGSGCSWRRQHRRVRAGVSRVHRASVLVTTL